jgi:hypothetical protein
MNPTLLVPGLLLCALPAVAGPTAPAWPDLRQALVALATSAGTTDLFQANPRLAEAFPSEDAFQNLVQKWRNQLTPLPADPDDLDPALIRVQVQENPEAAVVYLTFTDPKRPGSLTYLNLTWEARGLAKVAFFHGFIRKVPSGYRPELEYYATPRARH